MICIIDFFKQMFSRILAWRKTIGEKKLTNAEKQRHYRDKQNKEVQWEKDRIRKAISRESLKKDSAKYKNYLKQQPTNHRILRNKKKKNDQGTSPDNNSPSPVIVKMSFPSFSRSLNKAKKSLLKESTQRWVIAKALFEDSIHAIPKKKKDYSLLGEMYSKNPKRLVTLPS